MKIKQIIPLPAPNPESYISTRARACINADLEGRHSLGLALVEYNDGSSGIEWITGTGNGLISLTYGCFVAPDEDDTPQPWGIGA